MHDIRKVLRTIAVCSLVQLLLLSEGSNAVFSEFPVSMNITLGSKVMFTCAVPNGSMIVLSWGNLSGNDIVFNSGTSPEGVRWSTASFTATTRFNNTEISCNAGGVINGMGVFETSPPALLLLQGPLAGVGDLTSSEVDHCTLRLTWTPPYTLQGVPILNYSITINPSVGGMTADTSDSTEYLYTPGALGVTDEIVVAAINQVGPGSGVHTSVNISSSVSNVKFPVSVSTSNAQRSGNVWMYSFTFNEQSICTAALSETVYNSCRGTNSCVNGLGITSLPSTAGSVANSVSFTLSENKKYNTTVHVQYNGGVVQQSQPVEISSYDVQGADVTVSAGMVCITVQYIQGHEAPPMSFVKLRSTSTQPTVTEMIGTSGCLEVATGTYHLSVTDADAMDTINSEPAVTLDNILVPAINNNPSVNPSVSPGATNLPTGTSSSPPTNGVPVNMLPIIVGAAGGGGGAILILIILVIIIVIAVVVKKCKSTDDSSPSKSAKDEFTMTTSNTTSPLLEGHTASLPAQESLYQPNSEWIPPATSTNQQESNRSMVNKRHLLQSPSGSEVRRSTIEKNDLFEEEDECLEILHQIDNLVFQQATLVQLLLPLSSVWHQLGEQLGLTAHLEKIQVNNHGQDENCLRALLYVWEEQTHRKYYTWRTIIKILKELGAVRLANALAQRTDNHSVLQLQQNV